MNTPSSCKTSNDSTSHPANNAPRAFENDALGANLSQVKSKIVVLSGKGGVGKSTVAVNLAVSLSRQGLRVGLLDIDIHGPSVPVLLKLQNKTLEFRDNRIVPVKTDSGLKVVSIAFLLRNADDAVIWRGPMKYNVIKQFLTDVDWGELDFLVIDSPPGTGDEPLTVCQLLSDAKGAVIVTTPQEVALADVRKSIDFCRKVNMTIIGVVENMSGFVCPQCGHISNIFQKDGGKHLAETAGVPFLGTIPIDPRIVQAGDAGEPYTLSHPHSEITESFRDIVGPIMKYAANNDLV